MINKDGSVAVVDNGRGIPVDTMEKNHKSALEVVLTVLHAGGKFDKASYQVSGGLHGVGVSVVNALSNWLSARVYRDGNVYEMRFSQGKPTSPLSVHKETLAELLERYQLWYCEPAPFNPANAFVNHRWHPGSRRSSAKSCEHRKRAESGIFDKVRIEDDRYPDPLRTRCHHIRDNNI